MADIEHIDDHFALLCPCGSAKFALLRSGKIECHACGVRFGRWFDQDDEIDAPNKPDAPIPQGPLE